MNTDDVLPILAVIGLLVLAVVFVANVGLQRDTTEIDSPEIPTSDTPATTTDEAYKTPTATAVEMRQTMRANVTCPTLIRDE